MAVAIILAAGSGSRMQSDVAKQYMLLNEREVLCYALDTFNRHSRIDSIIVVARENEIEYCKTQIVDRYGYDKVAMVCAGGAERYLSVQKGLLAFGNLDNSQVVIIHDGARPFVTEKMIDDVIDAATSYQACTVAVPAKDTIKIVDENCFGVETPKREIVYQIQTPQAFTFGLLKGAYEEMDARKNAADYKITDDTMLVELYKGVHSKIVPGSYENIKITTPEDMKIASIFVEKIL